MNAVPPAPSVPLRWYEALREDVPDYAQRLSAWQTCVHRGDPGVLGQARDMLGASEHHPWYASPVHQPAQFYLLAHLAGSPNPRPWQTLWRELMAEHQDHPEQQRLAWSSIREALVLQALGPGHPTVLLEFFDWNQRLPDPFRPTDDDRADWVRALVDDGTGANVVGAPPAGDPQRNAGAKLLALLDAGHLAWTDVHRALDAPEQGIRAGNVLWQTPGMGAAIERGVQTGDLVVREDDVYHLWCSDDQALWDLAARLAPQVLDRGMAIVQNYDWWHDPSPHSLGVTCPVSRAAWTVVQRRWLTESLPSPRADVTPLHRALRRL